MTKNTICLWYERAAEEAAEFSARTCPGSTVGGCKDKWGLSWQITPRVLTESLATGGDVAKRAFEAMMEMKKIDIAKIEAAARGEA
jgi:predicted 3-demethylubiquinone-9 3-methyltransferase (glyoxalase superfamily)